MERDGYSDPRYYGEEGRIPEPTRGATTAEEGGHASASRPDARYATQQVVIIPGPRYINNPTQTSLERDGYSDPRYYGEEGRVPEATPGPETTGSPKVTRGAIAGEQEGYTSPNTPDSRDADAASCQTVTPYPNTPTQTSLERDGYSDPRYYGQGGRRPEATRGVITGEEGSSNGPGAGGATHLTVIPDPSYIDNQTRTSLERDGYSDPRYYGEEGRIPEATRGATTAEEGGHASASRPDARDATQQVVSPVPRYIDTPTRTSLERDGYSDPRYYGEEGRVPEATRGITTGEKGVTPAQRN